MSKGQETTLIASVRPKLFEMWFRYRTYTKILSGFGRAPVIAGFSSTKVIIYEICKNMLICFNNDNKIF